MIVRGIYIITCTSKGKLHSSFSNNLKLLLKNLNVICLTKEHQGVHKTSFRIFRAFQDRIGLWKCWFLRRGEIGVRGKKPLGAESLENQQQTQPTYDFGSGSRTRATLVGGERSTHYAIPTPLNVPTCHSMVISLSYRDRLEFAFSPKQ